MPRKKKEITQTPDTWATRLAELKAYREAHGNCDVPSQFKRNPALGRWVAAQRHKKKADLLTDDQVATLEGVGLVWVPGDVVWDGMLQQLREFKKNQGHCNVPEKWGPNPSLANWVHSQRHRKNKGRLAADRIRKLEKIGFLWSALQENPTGTCHLVGPVETTKPTHGERLYYIVNRTYVQHDGRGHEPNVLKEYVSKHRGEYPPYFPLPKGKTTFRFGHAFQKHRQLTWSGKGPLPPPVIAYVKEHGNLPPYD